MILSKAGEHFSAAITHAFAGNGSAITVLATVGLALCWGAWRLWTFTIVPILRPDEPKELPYLIPWFGHGKAFFEDSQALLAYGIKYFSSTRRIYSLTIAGESLYILTSPDDVTAAYKNTTTLTFDGFIHDLHPQFNMPPSSVITMQEIPPATETDKNPKDLINLGIVLHMKQLHPGSHFEDLSDKAVRLIGEGLRWENLSNDALISSPIVDIGGGGRTKEEKIFSLKTLLYNTLFTATTSAFFDPVLLSTSPTIREDFALFDDKSWMFIYKFPRAFAGGVYEAKERIHEALTKYFNLPLEERREECFYVKETEKVERERGLGSADCAALKQMFHWAAVTNAHKVAFWMLSHILHNPSLKATIITELTPLLLPTSSPLPLSVLESPINTPNLHSLFLETLRTTTAASSIRNISSPVSIKINNQSLIPGRRVLIPYRQLHIDESIWNPPNSPPNSGPLLFRADRFLGDEGRRLERSGSFRPFGGGTTLCSGRWIAKREVFAAVVGVLFGEGFDTVGVVAKGEMEGFRGGIPEVDWTTPAVGVVGPAKGEDVFVKLRPKAQGLSHK